MLQFNALAYRDYRSTANLQVYIFKDRIEHKSREAEQASATGAVDARAAGGT